jgi:hypothetical protein
MDRKSERLFVSKVKDLQPYYVFNPRYLTDAQIGHEMLKEAFDLETEKQNRADQAKREAEAARVTAARNVSCKILIKVWSSISFTGEACIYRRSEIKTISRPT